MRRRAGRAAALVAVLLATSPLRAATLKVPGEYATIKSAVNAARDGDVVLVDDGVYLERNIEVTRRILVKSKNLFGATIYGSFKGDSIFIIKSAARVEGFILKRAAVGIEQRDSPDVSWEAANLVMFDCNAGININDASENIGKATVRSVAIIGKISNSGITTNDAGVMDVADCLIAKCRIGFGGYNHRSFRVDDTIVLDCREALGEIMGHRPVPPATSRIDRGSGVRITTSSELGDGGRRREFLGRLRASVFKRGPAGDSARDETAKRAVLAIIEGGLDLDLGRYGTARESYERARTAAESVGLQELAWHAYMGLARVEKARGELAEAASRYKDAIEYLDQWLPSVPVGIYRINFLEDKMEAFEALIGLLLEQHERDPSAGHDAEAFLCAERSKTLGAFPLRRSNVPRLAADPRRDAQMAGAGKQIAALQIKLQDPDLGAAEKDSLLLSLDGAEEAFHAALLKKENAGRHPAPAGIRGIRESLAGRAVISYVLGDEGSYAFLLTGSVLEVARLPSAAAIARMVEPYLRFLQLAGAKDFRGARGGGILFDTLVRPLLRNPEAARRGVIIIPDGCLRYLPFEALVEAGGEDGEKGRRARFWGESAEVTYAPSVTFALFRAERAGKAGGAARILAVGNSDAIKCDNRLRNRKEFFSPLAHVKREIRKIGESFPRQDVSVLLDREAGEREFKRMDLAGYGIIHLAAHGVLDDADWWRSALLLGAAPSGEEDGFLTALEIGQLDLNARLVVLSACRTGAGSLFRGEGLKGLGEAFFRAGAESLVVSLWSVDDKATAMFMGDFYRLLAEGGSPAAALAGAKRRMIEKGYRNPFYWAPFVLIGRAPGPALFEDKRR